MPEHKPVTDEELDEIQRYYFRRDGGRDCRQCHAAGWHRHKARLLMRKET